MTIKYRPAFLSLLAVLSSLTLPPLMAKTSARPLVDWNWYQQCVHVFQADEALP